MTGTRSTSRPHCSGPTLVGVLSVRTKTARNLQFMSRLYSKSRTKRHHNRSSESDSEEPTTTSGIAPGRALYDTPPPDSQAQVLERSQRSRKASARKLESLESQAPAKAPQARCPATSKPLASTQPLARGRNTRIVRSPNSTDDEDNERDNTRPGKTRNLRPSRMWFTPRDFVIANIDAEAETATQPGPTSSDTQVATVGAPEDTSVKFLSKANVLFSLEERVGHKVSHLSTRELEDLANSISATEAASLAASKWKSPAVVQPATPLDVGGGYYRSRFRNNDVTSQPSSQPRNVTSLPPPPTESRERPTSSLNPFQPTASDDDEADDETSEAGLPPSQKRPRLPTTTPSSHPNNNPPAPSINEPQAAAGRTTATPPQTTNQPSNNPTSPRARSLDSLGPTESEPSDPGREAAGQPPPRAGIPTRPANQSWAKPRSPTPPREHIAPNANRRPDKVRPPPRSPTPPRTRPSLTSTTRPINDSADSFEQSNPPQVAHYLSQDDLKSILRWALDVTQQRLRQPLGVTDTTGSAGPGPHSSQARKRTRSSDGGSTKSDREALHVPKDVGARKTKKKQKKPGLGDYSDTLQQLAKAVIPDMMASAISKDGSYATVDEYCDWGERAFYRVWKRELPMTTYESPPYSYLKILGRRAGCHRGRMKVGIRVPIGTGYGFVKHVKTPEHAKTNRGLTKTLVPKRFYHRDTEKELDPYEHPAISESIAAAYFSDNKDLGVRFPHRFNPMPLPAVALVLTLMQFCICEWETGYHEPAELDAEEQQPVYEAHLEGLLRYADVAGSRLARFQEEWYRFGMECVAKPAKPPGTFCQPVLDTSRIHPDTPPPA